MTELDDLDRAVIAALEEDGRRPFREIARSLNVSEGTIRARYRRLEESGILKIAAFADPARFRAARFALLFLKVAPDRHRAVVDALCGYPQISYVSTTLAPADVFAQVLVADDNELWAFLQEKVRLLDGVLDTQVQLEIEVHKLWFDSPGPNLAPRDLPTAN